MTMYELKNATNVWLSEWTSHTLFFHVSPVYFKRLISFEGYESLWK